MPQVAVEQHVVHAPLGAELVEFDFAQAGPPGGVKLAHASAPGGRVVGIVAPSESRAVDGEAVDDGGQLARRPGDEGGERRRGGGGGGGGTSLEQEQGGDRDWG